MSLETISNEFGSIGLVSLFAAIGAIILIQIVRARTEADRRRIQIETQRDVMAAVMDVQNNFLNNIVYFHTRAEAGGPMTSVELHEIDAAIRVAQDRLIEIAGSAPIQTRDVGGVRVLHPTEQQFAS